MRSLRELTATSWAAVTCADRSSSPNVRWQALASRSVEERLGLALRALKIERMALRQRLQAAEQASKQAALDEEEDELDFF
jgi:hypothetical protein